MTSPSEPFTLAAVVRRHARERADSPAVTCGPVTRTFAELHARSSQVADALTASGVGHGDRVAVLDRNSAEFWEVVFGCAKIGAVVTALNWRLAAAEVAPILVDSGAEVLLVGEEQLGLVPDGALKHVVVMGGQYEDWLAGHPTDDPAAVVSEDDPALLLYSSGTTGRPKGAVITHANLGLTARMAGTAWRMGPDTVNMVPSPLFHIGGAGYGLTALSQGGHTVVMRDADPAGLLAAVQRHRVTHAFLVPAVVQSLLDHPDVGRTDLSSLQLVGYGAAPMTEALLRRALDVLGCQFLGVYGMTETAGTVCVLDPEDHDPGGARTHLLRSVGRPLPWVELAVKDPVTGQDLPPGEVGEIWVRTAQTMAGYWRQPEATAAALVEGGWLRTGDGASTDADGYVFLRDRIKDMIITGGENVYPAEVENVLASHPAVSDVAVIAVPHERWGETVKAVVVLHPAAQLTSEELRAFAREKLAGYKLPTSMDVVEALPRNASGKVLKRELRGRYWPSSTAGR
jgi:acyl-CoA synthetase (AMP-forming)/AMP-acid ligase II